MRFVSALLAISVGSLAAIAVPTATTASTTLAAVSTPNNSTSGTGGLIQPQLYSNKQPGSSVTEGLKSAAQAEPFYKGKRYLVQGWSVIIGTYIVDTVFGTTYRLPENAQAIHYLVNHVASSIISVIGNGGVNGDVSGGWHWYGYAYTSHYEFRDIPYGLLYAMITDAIHSANDWVVRDNVIFFNVNDSLGKLIFNFQIYPTVNNGRLQVGHQEL